MPVLASVDQFLELLRKSGLVEAKRLDAELEHVAKSGGPPGKPSQLAAQLVRRGLLTNFQATQLINGRWHGFFVGSKYKLLEPLGAGGMGKVFLCEHTLLKRLVAVKILPTEKMSDASLVERFHREAKATAALDHPNIVRCHDADKDNKLHYLVLEYVDGVSLQQLVAQNGPLDAARAAHYVSQAAAGLQHAHEAGWVHRDVKPGNLLVDRQGVVKILDLGLARILLDNRDQLTKDLDDKPVLGTADYLAPEQAMNSHDVDIRADIYGLGGTFYFLLTGRPPFADGTVTQKLLWHQVKEPEHVREIRPEVPVAMAAVLNQMMAKNPARRYQVPLEVVDALTPWTEAPIPSPTEKELPARSAAVQSLQPLSGSPSSSGAPNSTVRKTADGPTSRVLKEPTSGVAAPASSGKLRSAQKAAAPGLLQQKAVWLAAAGVVLAVGVGLGIWALSSPGPNQTTSSGPPPVTPPPTPVAPVNPTPAPTPPVAKPAMKTVAPEDAGKFLNQECTVRMQVRSVGGDALRFFLNSKDDYKADGNFTLVLDKADAEKFGLTETQDLRKKYVGKTLHVTGTVSDFRGRPQMRLKEPGQIQVEGN